MGVPRRPTFPKRPVEEKIAENILGAAVMTTTLLVSPLVGTAVFFVGIGASALLFRKSDFNREVKRLQKREYIALTKTDKGWIVKILKKGKERYKEIQIANLQLPKHKTWDGLWRWFVFDIPEAMRSRRDSLRRKLKNMGMYNIQRSVFVYPYDCRKELSFVSGYYDLDRFTTYAEVAYTDIDRELKSYFKSRKILP